jgi:hypothetical protein
VVGHLANVIDDAKRPSIARAELPLGSWIKGLGGAVEEAHPHLVTYHELHITVRGVIMPFCQLLCLEKTLANLHKELIMGAK